MPLMSRFSIHVKQDIAQLPCIFVSKLTNIQFIVSTILNVLRFTSSQKNLLLTLYSLSLTL